MEEVLGPAVVSDRIRSEAELEEGLYQLKRETEAPQAMSVSAWIGIDTQESKEHGGPKTGVLRDVLPSPQHFSSLRLCFFTCKMGPVLLLQSEDTM